MDDYHAKLYCRSKFFLPAHRDYFPEKGEMLMHIRQTRKPNESLLRAPFWASDALLAAGFSCARCVWMHLYCCAVNADNFGSYIDDVASLKFFKDFVYRAVFRPTIKSDIDRVPIAIFLWQCPPLAAVFYNVQQRTHKIIIWYRWFFALYRH